MGYPRNKGYKCGGLGGFIILFGWIIYGIAGLCVPFVFGPSGAGSLGDASAHRAPAFSLGGEKASAKRDLSRWSPRRVAKLRIRSATLRARLHELGSLRMKREGIAARTFRCYGIGGVWVVGCCWVRLEGFASRKEKSNTFRIFGKIEPRGFACVVYARTSFHEWTTLASPSP